MIKGVIYARYSSDSQTEQSIEGQLRVCNQFAQNNNIEVVATYIDRAMTGTNDNRPDFQRMIKDSSKQLWNCVIVYKLDRFSRNKYETAMHKKTLRDNGVKILSAMENIPNTPEGIILESLLEGMAEYYSAELSQKVLRGLNESYIKGNFTGGVPLYGYNVVDKKVVINETEAEIIKEIFTKFSQGYTGVDIAKDLLARGIKTKTGKPFNDKKIYKVIQNTKYIGKVIHRDKVFTNIYPAIVDEVTWQKVQNIRQSFKHHEIGKMDKFEYILSGKLVCGYCKNKIVGLGSKSQNGVIKYRYYTCLTKTRRKNIHCEYIPVRREFLEDEVMNVTWKVLSNKCNLKKLAKSIIACHDDSNESESKLKSLESARASLIKSTDNLISALEQGFVTEQTKFRLKELETQISMLDVEIEVEKQRNYTYLTEEMVLDFFNKVICGDIQNQEVRKQIVKMFIREILIYNDKMLIIYNFTDQFVSKGAIPDDVHQIELENLKDNLITENEVDKQADMQFFYSNEYFGVKKNIIKP